MPWRPWEELLALVELAAPSACAGCGVPGTRWCPVCAAVLLGTSPRSWQPTPCPPGFPPAWTGPAYQGPVRAAVVAWKEHGRVELTPHLASVLRGVLAAAVAGSPPHAAAAVDARPRAVALVPAPSAMTSVRARGRRPVVELAAAAARAEAVVDALHLVRRVDDQAGLSARARAANLRRAVAVRPAALGRLAGAPCVLVDDVVTTGATLQECARALRVAGAGPVVAVTVAATVRRD